MDELACELVQAGIGGRTIAELYQSMTMDEMGTWMAYREKHGPFNQSKRMERGFAMLALLYTQTHSKKGKQAKLQDFLPYDKPPEIIFGINDGWDD